MSGNFTNYILFILGFYFLIKNFDLLIDGAISLAKILRISDLIVALTIVSIGTSSPELFVNVFPGFTSSAGIGLENIFESNIANILFILGISSIIYPLSVKRNTILVEIPFYLTTTLLIGFLANAIIFQHKELSNLTLNNFLYINRWNGIVLLVSFLFFISHIIKGANAKTYNEKIDKIIGLNNDEISLWVM